MQGFSRQVLAVTFGVLWSFLPSIIILLIGNWSNLIQNDVILFANFKLDFNWVLLYTLSCFLISLFLVIYLLKNNSNNFKVYFSYGIIALIVFGSLIPLTSTYASFQMIIIMELINLSIWFSIYSSMSRMVFNK